jgi:hypothetical protein
MGGVSHELRRGVIFAYGPNVAHRIETDPKELLSKHYLNFSGREAADLMSAVALATGACRILGNADEIGEGFESLIDEGVSDRQQAQAIAALQLRILFLKMAAAENAVELAELRARQTLKRCLAHIDERFLEVRTIQEVAAACHVSVGHLTRSFMRFGYGSPYRSSPGKRCCTRRRCWTRARCWCARWLTGWGWIRSSFHGCSRECTGSVRRLSCGDTVRCARTHRARV